MTSTLASNPAVCPITIGRDDILASIDDHIAQARGGQCQVLMLSGAAGIGKTRLVTEAVARATRLGMTVFKGRCFELDQTLPYAPILDLFRTFAAQHSIEELGPFLGSAASDLARLLPELATALPVHSPTADSAPLALFPREPGHEKLALFESLTQVFIRFAAKSPILLILEDLHWSDDISLEFVHYAVRRFATHPIMLLLTWRSEETNANLNHRLVLLHRERLATEISLTPMTQDQVELMIRAILQQDRRLPGDVLDAVYHLTEGNPFFVEEVLKSLVVAGDVFYADGKWERKPTSEWSIPRSVQEAVQRRIAPLSERAREVLTVAAVAGRRFDFALLQALSGMNDPELLKSLKELVAVQLVIEESVDQFSFRHALTRLAVYATLLRRERQKLHREIAETLERVYAHSVTFHLADLSFHFFEGRAWDKSLEYSRRAGEQAQGLYAPRQAIEFFTRAIKSCQALLLPASPPLYRARGQAYETIGDLRAASTDYAVALTAARETGNTLAQWQSLIDLGSLSASRDYSKADEYFRQALALARTTGDRQMLAHSLNRIGNWHTNVGQHLEAIEHHEQARAIFQGLGDRRGLAQTLDLLGLARYDASDLMQGTTHFQDSIALARELDDRASIASSLATMTLGGLHYHSDTVVLASNGDENVNRGQEALKIAREMGWRSGEAYALLELAFCLTPRGEFAAAMRAARTAVEIAEEIEHDEWLAGALCALGAVELDLLDLPSARQHLERALALAQGIGSRIWLATVTGFLAQAYVWDNDLSLAETVLDAALGSASPSRTRAQRLCWCARAESALHQGNATQALEIVDQLIVSTPQRTPATVIPRLWSLRARALAAQRHFTEAEFLLEAAQATAFAQGARPLLWRIHLALGELYRARALRDEASTQFDAARRIVQDLAARIPDRSLGENFGERARAWIPRGGQLSARQSKKKEYAGLTSREREVASLIALGKSNREIAATLTITERTVGAHVGSILSKLDMTSRTQIAAWAIERGLTSRR